MSASQALLSHAHRADDHERPLSAGDPSAIRLLALPDTGPPFDDDPAAKAMAGTAAAVAIAGPGAETADPARVVAARAVDSSAHRAGEGRADADWARQFARLLTEALSGARPVRQMLPWTSERARVQLRALMPLFADGHRPRVVRVIATRPTRDVIEMTVVAGMGARTRALAVRLERAGPGRPPGWLNQAGRRGQPQLTALAPQASRPAKAAAVTAAPRWLCTDIEAA